MAGAEGLNNLFLPLSGVEISDKAGKGDKLPVMVMESSPLTNFPVQLVQGSTDSSVGKVSDS